MATSGFTIEFQLELAGVESSYMVQLVNPSETEHCMICRALVFRQEETLKKNMRPRKMTLKIRQTMWKQAKRQEKMNKNQHYGKAISFCRSLLQGFNSLKCISIRAESYKKTKISIEFNGSFAWGGTAGTGLLLRMKFSPASMQGLWKTLCSK